MPELGILMKHYYTFLKMAIKKVNILNRCNAYCRIYRKTNTKKHTSVAVHTAPR